MTARRRRFLELLAHGSSLAGACREVGVRRSTGNIWKNGTLVRRKDGTVKVVPPLEPLASRTIVNGQRDLPVGGQLISLLADR